MYIVVLWCERRKSGKTPPFSPMLQPLCMQMCPLHIIREERFSLRLAAAGGSEVTGDPPSKHAQSKLLIF